MQLPFIGPSYNLESRPASVQRTVNMMPVPLEVGNERTPWVLKDVPGLVEFGDFGPASPIEFVLAQNTAVGDGTIIVGAHQPGDFIVLFATTAGLGQPFPDLLPGWTSAITNTQGLNYGYRVMGIVDVAGTIGSLSVPNCTALSVCVYRNVSGFGVVGYVPTNITNPLSATFSSLGGIGGGSSWVLGVAQINQINTVSVNAGFTFRCDQSVASNIPSLMYDTGAVVTSSTYTGNILTWSTNSAYSTTTAIELVNG